MAKEKLKWKTAITKIEPDKITVHGYAIDELMGSVSYAGGLFLILKGELPTKDQEELLNTILVSSMDHGVTPPSALGALTCTSTGGNLSQAVACGILCINQYHGGAIENCQKMLIDGVNMMKEKGLTPQTAAEELVADALKTKKRLFGLGHRIHKNDPRTRKLFKTARATGFYSDHCALLDSIALELEKQKGKRLPINVDGAIAAVLCEMAFPPELGNAFFMIARMPGILAHYREEKQRQKPMRRINPTDYEYDGPDYREMPMDY